jgi:hypothetical protein
MGTYEDFLNAPDKTNAWNIHAVASVELRLGRSLTAAERQLIETTAIMDWDGLAHAIQTHEPFGSSREVRAAARDFCRRLRDISPA